MVFAGKEGELPCKKVTCYLQIMEKLGKSAIQLEIQWMHLSVEEETGRKITDAQTKNCCVPKLKDLKKKIYVK